jgi:hypothetical protein
MFDEPIPDGGRGFPRNLLRKDGKHERPESIAVKPHLKWPCFPDDLAHDGIRGPQVTNGPIDFSWVQ